MGEGALGWRNALSGPDSPLGEGVSQYMEPAPEVTLQPCSEVTRVSARVHGGVYERHPRKDECNGQEEGEMCPT